MQQPKISTDQILARLNIDALNEMQQASLESNDKNKDIILLSNTGSGKTLAFLLPLLANLDEENKQIQAMIIVPSRELAMQIEKVFKQMGTGYKITCCYGGHKREIEENNLLQPPAVVVGTPGRLADHLRRSNILPDAVKTLVLDEFDKTLELGFVEEMEFIVTSIPSLEQRILTSATAAAEIPEFIGLNDPIQLNFLTEEETASNGLAIKWLRAPDRDKLSALFLLVCQLGNRPMIIFCNHRESVERTSSWLSDKGILNVFYHGAMEQRDRDSALAKFRNGSINVLVTTDLAARGLDIPNIRYIIHYHLPLTEDSYTHRNGRTARMDASGTAIMILAPDEKMPSYSGDTAEEITVSEAYELPEKPKWSTLVFSLGKKDKINKVDIVGFLSKTGGLKKEDIGLIDVKDYCSFVAVRKVKVGQMLQLIKEQRIKNKKVKIEVAK